MTRKYLEENKVVVRVSTIKELEMLCDMYPFQSSRMEHAKARMERKGVPYCINYYKSLHVITRHRVNYNADNGYYEDQGYKVVDFKHLLNKKKITIKLPKHEKGT
jgi:hypothetical protein